MKFIKGKAVGLMVLGATVFCGDLMAQNGVVVDQNEIIEECLNDGLFTKQFSAEVFSSIETYYVVNNSTFTIPSDFVVDGKPVVVVAENAIATDVYFTLESVSIIGERATINYDFHYSANGVSTTQDVEAKLGVFNGHWSTMYSTLTN